MDFGKAIVGMVALAAGGLALYFFSKKGGSGSGVIIYEGEEYPVDPVTGEVVIPGGGSTAEEDLEPEYVPPKTYETQAPGADETYPLGSEENPLYTTIPEPMYGPAHWYVERDIFNVLGWSIGDFIAALNRIKTKGASERTAEEHYAGGYVETMQSAKYLAERYRLIELYGGSMEGGVLQPPPGQTVHEFNQFIKDVLKSRGFEP